ncbi:hypothetical protein V9L05_02915 [Bernardetia sp. Wsw4-3y2]|uniref:hypothetical protein n=1 Tax=Bernardetia sp. Wsw4-3y2 TaxID=3127471 RepID=UPI0030D21DDA
MDNYRNTDPLDTTNTYSTRKYREGGMMTGLFNEPEHAERAYHTLRERGYEDKDINVMMSDKTRDRHFKNTDTELGNKAMEGAGTGSAIGGVLGAVVGLVTAVALPGIGLGLVAAGPVLASLAGAGAGGLTGGLLGALVGSGIPEEHAEVYKEGIKNGGVVIGAKPRDEDDYNHIHEKWNNYQGKNVTTY